jgi:predicted nucleotidyltransferase
MEPSGRWRELLDQRLAEAVTELASVPGVRGLVVGGSLGRGAPWPLSDIDLVPVYAGGFEPAGEVDRRQAALVDWWAASGRAQTLDVGWLAFTDEEVAEAAASGPSQAAARMADRRWLHGVDKAAGGRAAADPDGVARTFLEWVDAVRFDPLVVAARVGLWWREAALGRVDAEAAWGAGTRTWPRPGSATRPAPCGWCWSRAGRSSRARWGGCGPASSAWPTGAALAAWPGGWPCWPAATRRRWPAGSSWPRSGCASASTWPSAPAGMSGNR